MANHFFLLCFVLYLLNTRVGTSEDKKMANKFFYFGFGSNMLAQRIQLQNPTAKRIGAGRLENYRLDFYTASQKWHGAPATIVPTLGAHVYGAIWEIDMRNLKDLDDQEGVHHNLYMPINVSVLDLNDNSSIQCRAYHLVDQPQTDLRSTDPSIIPYDRQPSMTYLKTLVKGAIETGIPQDYIKWLRNIKHNGQQVMAFEEKLDLAQIDLNFM